LGAIFNELIQHREGKVEEGHFMADHVPRSVSIPPRYSVSPAVGYIKAKSAIHIARAYRARRQNFVGQPFWARRNSGPGMFRMQEEADKRADRLGMFDEQGGALSGSQIKPLALPERQ